MSVGSGKPSDGFTIICRRCERPLAVRPDWVGREVECPHCAGVQRVPARPDDPRPVRAEAPGLTAKLRFNFGCPRCQTLLEAHTGMCGRPASCPTCAARLIVPGVDARTGQPLTTALLDPNNEYPTPLHAYAASGAQAPQIQRGPDGTLTIVCPRCGTHCDVDANSCPSCGAPFTIDAAPTVSSHLADAWGSTALVLGIASLPLFFLVVPAGLAVVLGLLSMRARAGHGRSRIGLVGLILGLISLFGGGVLWLVS